MHEEWTNEPARQVPVRYHADVIVAGGGVSGVAAAIAAARNGARTLLIERYGFCGGNAVIYLPLLSFLDQQGNEVVKGIGKEIIERVMALGGCVGHTRDPLHISYAPVDPEVVKRVVNEMLAEAGVDALLYTFITDVQVSENAITHLMLENKSGRSAATAEWVIDATGDADVAYRAGVPCNKGNASGKMQPATMMFHMGGVDVNEFRLAVAREPERYGSDFIPAEHYVKNASFISIGMRGVLEEAKRNGDFNLANNRVIFITQPRAGEVAVNTTRVLVDATDADDLTKGEMQARKDVWEVVEFLKTYVPGFAKSYLLHTAHGLGIRETRRITGEYVLDRDDILSCRRFADNIAVASYPIDIHDPNGQDGTFEHQQGTYDIPLRCLIPLQANNLLVVGRCISTTHEAHAAIRVMSTGMALGQAGGTAVAMAKQMQLSDIRQLDSAQLRERLLAQGAYL